jgi:hypothetical protein
MIDTFTIPMQKFISASQYHYKPYSKTLILQITPLYPEDEGHGRLKRWYLTKTLYGATTHVTLKKEAV